MFTECIAAEIVPYYYDDNEVMDFATIFHMLLKFIPGVSYYCHGWFNNKENCLYICIYITSTCTKINQIQLQTTVTLQY